MSEFCLEIKNRPDISFDIIPLIIPITSCWLPVNAPDPDGPPKRSQCLTSSENPHIMPHSVPGLMSPGMIPPTGLTAAAAAAANAAIAEAMKVKKIKLEAMSGYHGNAIHHGMDVENGDLGSSVGLELPFMMMPHPLIPVSLPPASVTMAMNQMNHLSTIANMAAAAQGQSLPSRMVTSVIKERVPDSPSPAPSLEDHRRPGSHPSSHRSSSVSSSPAHTESSSDRIPIHHNGMSMNHALLGLSPNIPPGPKEGDLAHDMSHEAKRMHNEKVYKSNMHFRGCCLHVQLLLHYPQPQFTV
ncbi:Dachshund like 1 [Dissostichus eleginoides]|uniref:Dachshund like 1 n=1 Tax=Dissostichus eleginoides TaxID=100907 RepID=A0AAD9CJE9_DISEL|nr:Dachshund like 1 [Dissostichus eleginoides]